MRSQGRRTIHVTEQVKYNDFQMTYDHISKCVFALNYLVWDRVFYFSFLCAVNLFNTGIWECRSKKLENLVEKRKSSKILLKKEKS